MNKKWILAITAFVITISVGFTNVHADPASDNAKFQQVQTQRKVLESKVEIMDNQIETIMSTINDSKNDIAKTQIDIKQAQIDIVKAEDDIKTEQDLFDKRMRAIYMNGSSSYLDIILGSKNLGDFISRIENCKTIISYDKNIINDYNSKKAAIVLKKVALDAKNKKLISLNADNEKRLADLTKQKSDQAVLLRELNEQERQYGEKLAINQAAVAASLAEIARIKSSSPNLIVSRGETKFSSNSVLAYASNYIGVPYVWGGTTPSGFDCSGFVQYVFRHFGVNLPRVSQDQQNVGTLVSRSNLQPGDLVFFGSPAHHVGIYVGNGNMINAPHTGDVIKIQPLNNDFTYGRRVN